MFLGSLLFWALQRRTRRWEAAPRTPAPLGKPFHDGAASGPKPRAPAEPWFARVSENTETICGGVIAGGALMAIGLAVLDLLVLPSVNEARAVAPLVKHAVEALAR
jgi:hypothetical protein